ncbi:cyclic pyranopterin monophosphate synthase [Geobacter sp. OR-1]|uniref:GTP 3',8-cyclase MoaA n=1 Tax=Geobacter sp. OR-1 TaxID=1266765 RepID=UPI00054419B9|nr:GTP 3',8-cyclase MoaA [Geobacter sp. OR-1]GAM11479.1 cyclic pyranopterin monophosphate synthase [Geobacter sp. OR-1]
MDLTDGYGRKINYLRLSVTDRCNMRCIYCMPSDGIRLLGHNEILSYEELLQVARAAVANGIEKIRVTGGEPLVRKGIIQFLEQLAAIPGLRQLVLTTNGLALAEMAEPLRRAGVQRLNISLDSLQPGTLASITRGADVNRVLAGIEAAERAGFPIKINMVVMAGINDAEILDFVALTLNRPLTVRFIEYMPAIRSENWEARVVPGGEILEQVGRRYSFTSQDRDGLAGPARTFRIDGATGNFGIITPVTGHFCEECNRIRVTASGRVRGCLFADDGLDLKPYLERGDHEELKLALRSVVACKPKQHALVEEEHNYTPFAMAAIGG